MAKLKADFFLINIVRARLLLLICCVVCYIGVVHNDYAFDDDVAFYQNQYVQKGISGIPDILTHPYYSSGGLTFDYRPVASVTFAIERELFGNNPTPGHVVNLLLYTICVLLVLSLMTEVLGMALMPAFIVSLFFAIHPVHTEVVASIKNREELFSLLFCLLAFISIHRLFQQQASRSRILYIALTVVCLALSLTSKLTCVTMFVIVPAILWYRGYHKKATLFYTIVSLVAILSIAYLVFILSISHRPVFDLENPLSAQADISTRIGVTARALLFYVRFMWVPYPFSFFYGYNTIPIVQAGDPAAILSILFHLVLFVYGSYTFVIRRQLTGFFIIAYFVSMSLYSNILIPYTGIVSERALFFPGLWFIAAVCSFIYDRLSSTVVTAGVRYIAIGAVAVMLVVFGTLDIIRVGQWHDNITLMSADIGHLGNSTLANYFYANILKNTAEVQKNATSYRQYMGEAKKYFYRTIDNSPGYPFGYFRLGLIYRYDEYTPDSARYYLFKAYQMNQTNADINYQYGRAQYEFGDMKKAADVFASLYKQTPQDTFTVFYHALLQLKAGDLNEGKRAADEFMRMAPGYYQSHFNMGVYYELVHDPDNAAREYQLSVDQGCIDPVVYRYLAEYYAAHGRQQQADHFYGLLR